MTLKVLFRRFLFLSVLWAAHPGVGLAGPGRWTSSGPEGATVLSVALDPADSATVFAGTQAGGVFKTSDSGARWSFAGLGGLSVSAIVTDPDGTKVYAAAGSNVFKSTDGGTSWRNASQGLPQQSRVGVSGLPGVSDQVSALAIDPRVPVILYAGVTIIPQSTSASISVGGGLFQSLDGGETWAPTGLAGVGVKSIVIDPTDSRTLYVVAVASGSYGTPNSVRKSTDGGATWAVLRDDVTYAPTMDITALMLDPGNPAVLYAAISFRTEPPRIEKSSDGGTTWTPAGGNPGGGRVASLLAAPSGPAFFYAATDAGIFGSADSGATWNRVLDTLSRCLAMSAANPAALYAGAGDGILASLDAGVSWTVSKAGLIATSIRDLLANPRSREELYARSDVALFHSADGGASWNPLEDLPSAGGFALDWKNSSIQYIGTMNGGLCTGVSRTLDGGRSWTPTSLTTGCILRIVLDPQNPDTVYAVGQFGLWKSTDGGGSWSSSLNQPISVFAIASPAILYVGVTNQGFVGSRDGGVSWNPLTALPCARSNSCANREFTSLVVDPVTPATVYVSVFDPSYLVPGSGGPTLVDSAAGVFKTTDGGATWREVGRGLRELKGLRVSALAIDPSSPNVAYAGTGAGVFRSSDGGETFFPFSVGLTNLTVSAIQIDASGRSLHAATQGGGVFDYAIPPDRLTIVPPHRRPASRTIAPRITSGQRIAEFTIPTPIIKAGPNTIVVGPDGNLWFTELWGKIGRITTTGVITEFATPTERSIPSSITAGPDGNLWFTESGPIPMDTTGLPARMRIGRITTTGVITEFTIPTANSQPSRIVAGPDGNLWFAEIGGIIGRITTSGVITEFAIPTAGSQLSGMVAGPDGNVWFTETGAIVGRITTTGVITEFAIPTAGTSGGAIVAGPDGNLWFTESNKIGRITTTGAITEFAIPTAGSSAGAIVAGPDGNLWFTETGGIIGRITTTGVITEFAILTAGSSAGAIVAGPDGNLWFTESNGNRIGRITTAGVITEFAIPTANSQPSGIVAGPDGNVWFTEYNADKIGRINLLASP